MEIEHGAEYGLKIGSDITVTVVFHTAKLTRLSDNELEKMLRDARETNQEYWERAENWIRSERTMPTFTAEESALNMLAVLEQIIAWAGDGACISDNDLLEIVGMAGEAIEREDSRLHRKGRAWGASSSLIPR